MSPYEISLACVHLAYPSIGEAGLSAVAKELEKASRDTPALQGLEATIKDRSYGGAAGMRAMVEIFPSVKSLAGQYL